MSYFRRGGLNEQRRRDEMMKVAEQAAAWLIELEDGGDDVRAAVAVWLEESPLHVEMFLRATSVDRIAELMTPGDVAILARKLWPQDEIATAPAIQLHPTSAQQAAGLHSGSERAGTGKYRSKERRRFMGLAAAAVSICVLASSTWWFASRDTYSTGVGEQMSVKLPDGSMMHLNTDSRAVVNFTGHARMIKLESGEALFTVQHDTHRPFDVQTAGARIRAVGTQFNVYRRSVETKVAVIEGVVQISKPDGASVAHTGMSPAAGDGGQSADGTERLTAGQGLILREDGFIEQPIAVNVTQVTAWRQRRLVFEWQTLEEIAAEFNRYNRVPHISVEGDVIRSRRYTAVFDADNPQTLLKFLSKDDDLRITAAGDDFVIRAR